MAIAATGTITVNGSGVGPLVGAVINGVTVTTARVLTNALTATALALAINTNVSVNGLVVAVAVGNVVTLTAVTLGTSGNAITLVASGTNIVVSASTLLGGLSNPVAPVVTSPANGSTVLVYKPTYVGTAVDLSTVTVYVDNVSIGTTTAFVGGAWVLNQPTNLSQGSHAVKATATDAVGTSVFSTSVTFTVSVAPDAPVITAVSRAPFAVITGTCLASATVNVYVDDMLAGTCTASVGGTWSYTLTFRATRGLHSVKVSCTDSHGTSPFSPPTSMIATGPDMSAGAAQQEELMLLAVFQLGGG